jgi:hypothetical protein
MKVVYVYTGQNLPKYVVDSLRQVRQRFPELDLWFISDSSKSLNQVARLGLNTWQCSDPQITFRSIRDSLDHPMGFRNAFWFRPLARFFMLRVFMLLYPQDAVLHIECDVWLAPNFPFQFFESCTSALAFPLISSSEASASTLFIHDLSAAEFLASRSLEILSNDSSTTDMRILSQIGHEHQELVFRLPSETATETFLGIIDPAPWGMYLFGIDPRNHQGVLKLYEEHPGISTKLGTAKFQVGVENSLTVESSGRTFSIFSLHIHSKDKRIFSLSSEREILLQRTRESSRGPKRVRLWPLTFILAWKAILRRFGFSIG